MTMDRTLKTHGGLMRTRNVLTRAERIAKLMEEGKFDPESDNPLGLPKVRVRHLKVGTKTKKAAEETPAEAPAEELAGAEGAGKEKAPAEAKGPEAKTSKGTETKAGKGAEAKGAKGAETKARKGAEAKGAKGAETKAPQGKK